MSYLGLLALLEEGLLAVLLGLLLPGEVGVAGDLLNDGRLNAGNVNLGPGGDNVAGVDASDGNTVDLEGTGDEENTLVKSLEEDNTLATETTGKEDQDGTGLEGGARLVWADSLADLRLSVLVGAQEGCSMFNVMHVDSPCRSVFRPCAAVLSLSCPIRVNSWVV